MSGYIHSTLPKLTKKQKQKIVCTFIERTYHNLEQYQKEQEKENSTKTKNYQFEVTQILNSFLGLVALPQQQMESLIAEIDVSDLRKKIKIEKTKTPTKVFKHLRNAVSHGNFLEDMELDEQHDIQCITFKDYEYKKTGLGKQNFEITLSIEEILNLIKKVYVQSQKICRDSTL